MSATLDFGYKFKDHIGVVNALIFVDAGGIDSPTEPDTSSRRKRDGDRLLTVNEN